MPSDCSGRLQHLRGEHGVEQVCQDEVQYGTPPQPGHDEELARAWAETESGQRKQGPREHTARSGPTMARRGRTGRTRAGRSGRREVLRTRKQQTRPRTLRWHLYDTWVDQLLRHVGIHFGFTFEANKRDSQTNTTATTHTHKQKKAVSRLSVLTAVVRTVCI